MSNGISIEIGGENRTLRFGHLAIANLEKSLGMSVTMMIQPDRLGVNVMLEALVHGLRHENRGLTVNKVAEWLDDEESAFEKYVPVIVEALTAAMGFGKDNNKETAAGEATAQN